MPTGLYRHSRAGAHAQVDAQRAQHGQQQAQRRERQQRKRDRQHGGRAAPRRAEDVRDLRLRRQVPACQVPRASGQMPVSARDQTLPQHRVRLTPSGRLHVSPLLNQALMLSGQQLLTTLWSAGTTWQLQGLILSL